MPSLARHFPYRAPRLKSGGQAAKPNSIQQSVYYWWWVYLREHEGYRRCCERGGTGQFAKLYRDFGDVHAADFGNWWTAKVGGETRGAVLFAEPVARLTLRELKSVKQWEAGWNATEIMVVVVPLTQPKKHLRKRFATLLKKRHRGAVGKQHNKVSAARYPVAKRFTIAAFRQALEVLHHRQSHPDRKLWQIGEDLKLVRTAMPKYGDTVQAQQSKRRVMSATVTRYTAHAKALIDNAARGIFP